MLLAISDIVNEIATVCTIKSSHQKESSIHRIVCTILSQMQEYSYSSTATSSIERSSELYDATLHSNSLKLSRVDVLKQELLDFVSLLEECLRDGVIGDDCKRLVEEENGSQQSGKVWMGTVHQAKGLQVNEGLASYRLRFKITLI